MHKYDNFTLSITTLVHENKFTAFCLTKTSKISENRTFYLCVNIEVCALWSLKVTNCDQPKTVRDDSTDLAESLVAVSLSD